MAKIALLILSAFCFVHIYRDYLQIKYGYRHWFTRFGHFWHAPKYEKHGMVVFGVIGILCLYFALK